MTYFNDTYDDKPIVPYPSHSDKRIAVVDCPDLRTRYISKYDYDKLLQSFDTEDDLKKFLFNDK